MSIVRDESRWWSAILAVAVTAALAVPATTTPIDADVSIVVRGVGGRVDHVVEEVGRLGGVVIRRLDIIDGVAARLPAAHVAQLRASASVAGVTSDQPVSFHGSDPLLGYDPVADFGSLHDVTKIIGAQDSWKAGYTGKGVDIALLDTGVSPVAGLTSGNVINGPDLSFDSQNPDLTNNDGYGHGTHMASLMVARDKQATGSAYASPATFSGVAPDARLVSVKVGAADGAADVSQVIAGVDWVVQHARDGGLNIRVLSLSFGTDSVQDYRLDPLAHAAEMAWRSGIVVVVSGGNDGRTTKILADPARNPLLLAVGASDPVGTLDPTDDLVPEFATRGESSRHVDVVAPGVHILGLRSPGSFLDQAHPSARVGTRFFRGSGTSQAAAITAGGAALFLQRYPTAKPDQLKKMFMTTAIPLKSEPVLYRGNGSVQVRRAQALKLDSRATQTVGKGTGTGSLEGARGSAHVADDGDELVGEVDIFQKDWKGTAWASGAATRTNWLNGVWNGSDWTGVGWTGTSWTPITWTGRTWTAGNWAGRTWTGRTWTGRTWTATGWDGGDWSGRTWTGRTWTTATWSTGSWS